MSRSWSLNTIPSKGSQDSLEKRLTPGPVQGKHEDQEPRGVTQNLKKL